MNKIMYLFFGLLVIIVLFFGMKTVSMSTNQNKGKYKVYHEKGITLGVDFGKLGKKAEVLFFDTSGVILGINECPYSLIANPDFDFTKLPIKLQANIYESKILALKGSFIKEDDQAKKKQLRSIPLWIHNFKKIKQLKLTDVKVESLLELQSTSLHCLILHTIIMEDRSRILNQLVELKTLKYLVHNNLFDSTEVHKIKEMIPDINVMLEEDYYEKIETGEISENY